MNFHSVYQISVFQECLDYVADTCPDRPTIIIKMQQKMQPNIKFKKYSGVPSMNCLIIFSSL